MGLTNDELYDVFAEWNRGELDSYLIEITRDIFSVKDDETGGYLVDKILDTAGAKGTGKWMSQLALDLGVPSTLVTEAVYARCLSAMKEARVRASKVLAGPSAHVRRRPGASSSSRSARPCTPRRSAATPRALCRLQAAADEHDWPLNYGELRDAVAGRLHHPGRVPGADQGSLRRRSEPGEPAAGPLLPGGGREGPGCLAARGDHGDRSWAFRCRPSRAALAYYDGYRRERLPANLLQAQRDYFGAHTYERLDKPGSVPHRVDQAAEASAS